METAGARTGWSGRWRWRGERPTRPPRACPCGRETGARALKVSTVAALALGVQRVKHQAGFARAAGACHHPSPQPVRDVQIQVLKVCAGVRHGCEWFPGSCGRQPFRNKAEHSRQRLLTTQWQQAATLTVLLRSLGPRQRAAHNTKTRIAQSAPNNGHPWGVTEEKQDPPQQRQQKFTRRDKPCTP